MNAVDSLRRFEADGYRLHVAEVPAREPALSWLADAVLLEKVSPLLHCIDLWMGNTLDWMPACRDLESMRETTVTLSAKVPVDAVTPATRITTAITDATDTTRISSAPEFLQVGLCINPDRIASMPQWPAGLDEFVAVRWAERAVKISLGEVDLGAGDLARAGQGSLLVLPSSFEPTMQVSLNCAISDAQLGPALLDWRKQELVLNMPVPDASSVLPGLFNTPEETGLKSGLGGKSNASEGQDPIGSAGSVADRGRVGIWLGDRRYVPVRAWFAGTHRQEPLHQPFNLCSTAVVLTLNGVSWHGEIVPLGDGLGVLMGTCAGGTPAWI